MRYKGAVIEEKRKEAGVYGGNRRDRSAEWELLRLFCAAMLVLLTLVMIKTGKWEREDVAAALHENTAFSIGTVLGDGIREETGALVESVRARLHGA